MQTIKELERTINSLLQSIYPPQEAEEISYRLLDSLLSFTKIDIALNPEAQVSGEQEEVLNLAVDRLLKNEPLQYVLGVADFYDLTFKVNTSVLIPRPETEELVKLIIDHHKHSSASILDIGTGSGCIPISLKKNIPNAKVSACDISQDALALAKENAVLNTLDVDFFHCDILDEKNWPRGDYDVIVSNPPYVLQSEKELMRDNVLAYEPHLALFVDDDDPLIFYSTIAKYALNSLKVGGSLYFEINEAYGAQTIKMLKAQNYVDISLHQDIFGKERMVSARRSS